MCNWPHFESEGIWNSEVAYWILFFFVTTVIPKKRSSLRSRR